LLLAAGVVTVGVGAGVGLQQAGVFGDADSETVEVAHGVVPVADCPGGQHVGELQRGDRVLATGRDQVARWVEVRDPRSLGTRVWIARRFLVPDADVSGLAVRECARADEQAAAAATTTVPPSLPGAVPSTGVAGGITTLPGAPPPVPAPPGSAAAPAPPGPAPDTAGPTIGSVSASPSLVYLGAPCVNTSIVNVNASDPSGVSAVSVSYEVGNAGGVAPPQGGGYRVGPLAYQSSVVDAAVTLTIEATDGAGNTTTIVNTTALHADTCVL
jgi:hypothetical protein